MSTETRDGRISKSEEMWAGGLTVGEQDVSGLRADGRIVILLQKSIKLAQFSYLWSPPFNMRRVNCIPTCVLQRDECTL